MSILGKIAGTLLILWLVINIFFINHNPNLTTNPIYEKAHQIATIECTYGIKDYLGKVKANPNFYKDATSEAWFKTLASPEGQQICTAGRLVQQGFVPI